MKTREHVTALTSTSNKHSWSPWKKMSKDSRSGGKYSGNHTTLTPLAATVCDIANVIPQVTKISPGYLKGGQRSVSGQRRVKITRKAREVLLSVRDTTSHQEVHVYADDIQEAALAIARGCRDKGVRISFGK